MSEDFQDAIRNYLNLKPDDFAWEDPNSALDHADLERQSETAKWFYYAGLKKKFDMSEVDRNLLDRLHNLFEANSPGQWWLNFEVSETEFRGYTIRDIKAAWNASIPPSLRKYQDEARKQLEMEADPEYQEYLRLKGKFEGKT